MALLAKSSPRPMAETPRTVRRFVLGRQGLWPGRRWKGRRGLEPTIASIGSVQYDPLNVIGRSHDLALWGRIAEYRPSHLEDALYRRRTVFESGGNVQIRPMHEWPYYAIVRERKVAERRWREFRRGRSHLLARVVRELERRGPLGASDFHAPTEQPVRNYRARTQAALALYYLWLEGRVMVAFRRNEEKVFDLTTRLLRDPPAPVPEREAEEHLVLQALADLGLASGSEWLRYSHARIARLSLREDWKELVGRWSDRGVIREVKVEAAEGKGSRWVLGEAAPDLEIVRSGGIPAAWRTKEPTTDEEVVFLAPLDRVVSGGRSRDFFGFDYVWEVYKPPSKRRWGYYTLPILFGDELVARAELRLDRPLRSVRVLGFWPERRGLRNDLAFATALGRALVHLAGFHGVTDVDVTSLPGAKFWDRVRREIRRA